MPESSLPVNLSPQPPPLKGEGESLPPLLAPPPLGEGSGERSPVAGPLELYTGIAEFNRSEYFECHETLETIWMHEPGTIRRLYQGILQVGVGFYHLRNGNYRGTLNLLHSAAGYLRDFAPTCLGVDVAALLHDAAAVRAAVEAAGPDAIQQFPLARLPRITVDPAVAAQAVATPPPAEGEGEGGPGHW